MLVGEDMPDKNDPKSTKRYEKEVAAGRKFAKTARIDPCFPRWDTQAPPSLLSPTRHDQPA